MVTRKDKTVAEVNLADLTNSETAKQFGFKFVSGDEVPPPPREREQDTERWNAVKVFLKETPAAHGQWAMIKEYSKAGTAAAKASRINNDYEKAFPKSEGWEARSQITVKKTDNDPGKSELFIRFVPPTAKPVAK